MATRKNNNIRTLVLAFLFFGLLLGVVFGEEEKKGKSEEVIPEGMVAIPSGTFKLFFKDKEEKPVEIKSFYLDIYAVTNQEYLEFVKENPSWQKSKVKRMYADVNYLKHWEGDLSIGSNFEKIKNSPVTNVSWFAASAYAKWKNKRLPTVLEWEYVASADMVDESNNKVDTIDFIIDWYAKPNLETIPEVGSSLKNAFGVHDMHGLIWEWAFDFNSFVSSGDSRSNSEMDRDLFCGGAAAVTSANKEDYATYMRYGFRGSLKGNYTVSGLGFRCATDNKR